MVAKKIESAAGRKLRDLETLPVLPPAEAHSGSFQAAAMAMR
jgi:hypothetical protein